MDETLLPSQLELHIELVSESEHPKKDYSDILSTRDCVIGPGLSGIAQNFAPLRRSQSPRRKALSAGPKHNAKNEGEK